MGTPTAIDRVAGIIAGCIAAISWPQELPAGLPWWSRACHLGAVVAGTIVSAYLIQNRLYFYAGLGMLVAFLGRLLHISSIELRRVAHWDGAGDFVLGLVWLALAVLISSAKGGLGKYIVRFVPRSASEKPQGMSGGT